MAKDPEYRCEAGVDVDYSGFAPLIRTCGKPAKLYGMAALCDECAPKILTQEAEAPDA